MNRKPLVNIPKPKKQKKPLKRSALANSRKPIKKVGKRGAKKKADKKAAVDLYFELHGWAPGKYLEGLARCQMCGRPMLRSQADPCHKIRASQGGSERPENIVAAHRLCHTWQHSLRQAETALVASEADCRVGGQVKWPLDLLEALNAFLDANWAK